MLHDLLKQNANFFYTYAKNKSRNRDPIGPFADKQGNIIEAYNGIEIKEVYSPFPVHGLDKALGLKETRMGVTSFIYGCIGFTFAFCPKGPSKPSRCFAPDSV